MSRLKQLHAEWPRGGHLRGAQRHCDAGVGPAGRLPFDTVATEAMVQGEPVTAYQPDGAMATALRKAGPRLRSGMDLRSIELKHKVTEWLEQVIDPETGVDVMRMRLIEDLEADAGAGRVSYRFRPSSPLCPLAVHLALDMRRALAAVQGVTEQEIEVVGYVGAEELNVLLKAEA